MPNPGRPLLIFDFDGTLANTIEAGIGIFNSIAADYGLQPVTMSEVRELRKLNTRAMLDHVGLSRLAAVKLGTHVKRILNRQMDQVEMFDGIEETIRNLHREGFEMGILSSNSVDNVRTFIKRFGLGDCFAFIEAGVSLFGKSHRLNTVMRKRNTGTESVAYVGDETRDMEAARDSKIKSIAVCWGANAREAMLTEGPDYCVEEAEELLAAAREFQASLSPVT
ncbi:MAG: HAD hydrolase-like protein [Verrucomicrobiota bacterium]